MSDVLLELMEAACLSGDVGSASLSLRGPGQSFDLVAGLADPRGGTPVTPDTLFHIGSVTKSLTAELVRDQIRAGRLTDQTALTDAAPETRRIAGLAGRHVTIEQLLSHTSGIDGDVLFDAGRGRDVLRRFISRVDRLEFLFEPGGYFSYANFGYGLLGRVVELAGGRPYETALAESLRDRHGLARFALKPEEKARFRLALAYEDGRPVPAGPHSNLASGTMLAMAPGDLALWGLAQVDDREMSRQVVATPSALRYRGWGRGFMLFDHGAEPVFGHDGGTAGTASFLRIAPSARAAWAFSATGPRTVALYRQLEPHLRAGLGMAPARSPEPPGSPPPERLDAYAGRYQRHGMTFDLRSTEAHDLTLEVSGDYAPTPFSGARLRPLTDRVFEADLPGLAASVWVGFDDFDAAGRPRLFSIAERMAARA